MPITTPEQKVYKTKQFWWKYINVELIWDTFDDALKASLKFKKDNKAIFIHPFDDMKVIEWQATVWLEIFEEIEPDYYICPIWWGWFISGQIIAKNLMSPKTTIIWVEPEWADAMKKSLESWNNLELNKIDVFVDWTAVKKEWELTYKICKNDKLKIVECPENRICTTILDYLKEDWIVVEPAWALTTDALKDLKEEIKWKKIVIVISGSNFDFERLPEIKERSMKFEYLKKSAKNTAPVFIWIKTDNNKNWTKIENKINKLWFKYKDVTNYELYFDLLV